MYGIIGRSFHRLWQAWTEPLHPLVVQLQTALDRKLIAPDHMLLQLLRCGLDQAMRPKSGVFTFPPAIKTWAESLEFYGGDFVMKLLRGARKEGKCKQPGVDKSAFSFAFATLPLPSKSTILKGKPGYIPVSGVSPQILGSFIDLLHDPARQVLALVSSPSVVVYAVALCRDGMAIKPGLQFDQTTKCVVGLEEPELIDIEYVRQSPRPSPDLLRRSLVVEAHEAVLTPLSAEFSMPVATLYRGKSKTSASVLDETSELLLRVTTCKRCCLYASNVRFGVFEGKAECSTTSCDACVENKAVCVPCSVLGHQDVSVASRSCDQCVASKSTCVRLFPVVWCADAEAVQRSAMDNWNAKRESSTLPSQLMQTAPAVDPPHIAKCIRGSIANYYLDVNGCRSSIAQIEALQKEGTEYTRRSVCKLVSAAATRLRDRMDQALVLEISEPKLVAKLRDIESITTQLIPSKRPYKGNNIGVITEPTSACRAKGLLLVTDASQGTVVSADNHNPANVYTLAHGLSRPDCITAVAGGLVCFAETMITPHRLVCIDLDGKTVLDPAKLLVTNLVAELKKRKIDHAGTKSVLQQRLTDALQREAKRIDDRNADTDVNMAVGRDRSGSDGKHDVEMRPADSGAEVKRPKRVPAMQSVHLVKLVQPTDFSILALLAHPTEQVLFASVVSEFREAIVKIAIVSNGLSLRGDSSMLFRLPKGVTFVIVFCADLVSRVGRSRAFVCSRLISQPVVHRRICDGGRVSA